jgi:hypothetical protein
MRKLTMIFDLEGACRGARNVLDYLNRQKTPDFGKPKGNFGIHDISDIVKCVVFGLADQAIPFVPRANHWIDQGIASREYDWFGGSPEQHQHNLHWGRALGTWLEYNGLAVDHWIEARRYLEAWWAGGFGTRQQILRWGLDDYMALSVLGSRADSSKTGLTPLNAGIEMFERSFSTHTISLKKTLKPRQFGYALCRHYLNNEFDRADILKAGRRMLAANLTNAIKDGWLENGQSTRAAMWLMLVYWYPALHNGEILPSPVDILLKAYDDIPGVVRPF